MNKEEFIENQVLIVGAGPTGLTLACELARHGVKARIIDKDTFEGRFSKASAIHSRTMEIFENMGIIQEILAEGTKAHSLSVYTGNEVLFKINLESIETKYPFVHNLPQSQTEKILMEHLNAYGIEVERESELLSFVPQEGYVETEIKDKDGKIERQQYSFLFGFDGAHSTVRKGLNFQFEGAPYPHHWLLADVNIKWDHPIDEISMFSTDEGAIAFFPLFENRNRILFELNDAPIDMKMPEPTLETLIELFDKRKLKFHSIDKLYTINYFKLHHRLVNQYQKGRIFIGGDAAHIHSPAGGQGLNTGIQDAYNLAWKVALVLKNKARLSLLDSYQAERRRIGEGVVRLTDTMTKMIALRNPILRAIRNKIAPIVTRIGPVQEKMLSTVSQIEVNYRKSAIVKNKWKSVQSEGKYHAANHDLAAGERIDDHTLFSENHQKQTTLYDLFTGYEHELLLFTGVNVDKVDWQNIQAIYNYVVQTYGNLIESHLIKGEAKIPASIPSIKSTHVDKNYKVHQYFGAMQTTVFLIRPDGYIAFRNQPATREDLKEYLQEIFVY